ncbi:MAG: hypothetical protein LBU99_03750 [Spirochaetaceae bacterium]|jgi:hypothetical protein|nr:hypothetical protein [Spirochaetaceae bacterium]
MKAKILLILLMVIRVCVYGQQISIAKVLPFGEPIQYYTEWDRNEGGAPGIAIFRITSNGNFFLKDVGGDIRKYSADEVPLWRVYDSEMEEQISIESMFQGTSTDGVIGRYFYFGTRGGSEGWIRVYDERISLTTPAYIFGTRKGLTGRDVLSGSTPPYITGNIFFWETSNGDLVSWELLGEGQTQYRGIEETKQWLAEGNAEKVGYHKSNGRSMFGDFYMISRALNYWKKEIIFPEGEYKELKNPSNFWYIGTDGKGLNYYRILKTDKLLRQFPDSSTKVKTVIAIEDTWTGKVVIREYPEGTWDPPRRDYEGRVEVVGMYPWAVHPNGDVYYWDADTEKEEYQLKRLVNDWWEEIGIPERKIGRIKENYIPLRLEKTEASGNNGYNYENEYVWIKEESEDGWVLIEKIDGRVGWIKGSSIYYDQW